MTITNSIASQSIGTSTNVGDKKFPQVVDRQTTTTSYNLVGRITNGAAEYDPATSVVVYYASSPFSVTAVVGAATLRPSGSLRISLKRNAADVAHVPGANTPMQGRYIYFWCEVPKLTTAATLDVSLVEFP